MSCHDVLIWCVSYLCKPGRSRPAIKLGNTVRGSAAVRGDLSLSCDLFVVLAFTGEGLMIRGTVITGADNTMV